MAYNSEIINTEQWDELNDDAYNSTQGGNYNCFVSVDFHHSSADYTNRFFNLPIYPEDVSFGVNTSYASTSVIGRPGEISGYNNTSDQTSSFSLHLHRELKTYGNNITDVNHIDAIVALITAAQYPKRYQDGLYFPITTYKFGDTLLIGKQNSVNVKWSGPKIRGAFMECMLNISFTNIPDRILFFDDVRLNNPRGYGKLESLALSTDTVNNNVPTLTGLWNG